MVTTETVNGVTSTADITFDESSQTTTTVRDDGAKSPAARSGSVSTTTKTQSSSDVHQTTIDTSAWGSNTSTLIANTGTTTLEWQSSGYSDSGETGSAGGKESESLATFTYDGGGNGNSAEGMVRSKQKSSSSSGGGASVSTYSNEMISTMDFQFESGESSGGNSSHIKGRGNQRSESSDGGGTRTDAEGHTTTSGGYKTKDSSSVSFVFTSGSSSGSAGQSQSSGIGAKGTTLSYAESGGAFNEVDGVRTGSGSYKTAESSGILFDFISNSSTKSFSSTTTQISSTNISANGVSASFSSEEGTYTETAEGKVKTGSSGQGSTSKVNFDFTTETSSRSTASGYLVTNFTRMGAEGSSLTIAGSSVNFGGSETFTSVSNSTVDFKFTSTANTGTSTGGTNTTISATGQNLASSAEGGTEGNVEFTEIATSNVNFAFNSVTTTSSTGGGLTSNTETRIGASGTTLSSSSDVGTQIGDSRHGTLMSDNTSNVDFTFSSINNRLLTNGFSSSAMSASGTTGSNSSMNEDYQEDGENRHADGNSQSSSSNTMLYGFTTGTSTWGGGTSGSTMSVSGAMNTSSQGFETYSESAAGRSSFGGYVSLASNSFNYSQSSASTEGENSQSNFIRGFMSMSFSDGGSFTSAPGPYAEPTVTSSGSSSFNMTNIASYNNSQSTSTIDGNSVTTTQQSSSGSNNTRFYDSSSYENGYVTGDSGNSTSGTFNSRNQTTTMTTEWMEQGTVPVVTTVTTTTTSTGSNSQTQTSSYSPDGANGTITNSSSNNGTTITVTNPGGTTQSSSSTSNSTTGAYNSRVVPWLPSGGGGGPTSINFNLGGLPSLSGGGGGGAGAGGGQMTAAEWEEYYRENTPGLADYPEAGSTGGVDPEAISGAAGGGGSPPLSEAEIKAKVNDMIVGIAGAVASLPPVPSESDRFLSPEQYRARYGVDKPDEMMTPEEFKRAYGVNPGETPPPDSPYWKTRGAVPVESGNSSFGALYKDYLINGNSHATDKLDLVIIGANSAARTVAAGAAVTAVVLSLPVSLTSCAVAAVGMRVAGAKATVDTVETAYNWNELTKEEKAAFAGEVAGDLIFGGILKGAMALGKTLCFVGDTQIVVGLTSESATGEQYMSAEASSEWNGELLFISLVTAGIGLGAYIATRPSGRRSDEGDFDQDAWETPWRRRAEPDFFEDLDDGWRPEMEDSEDLFENDVYLDLAVARLSGGGLQAEEPSDSDDPVAIASLPCVDAEVDRCAVIEDHEVGRTQLMRQHLQAPASSNRFRRVARPFGLVVSLLLSAICLWNAAPSYSRSSLATIESEAAATPQIRLQTASIESIKLGQRVVGHNPIRSEVDESIPDVDPNTWRKLCLTMIKRDGDRLDIELLRPATWLSQMGAQSAGDTIQLDLPEMGAEGEATVLAIEPCPPIQDGPGNVCTGKFIHESSHNLLDLKLEGQVEATGVTGNHPYWSVDRQEFVPAEKLRVGDKLQTAFGSTKVLSITPRSQDEVVYNLEIHREHVYLVGSLGTLVHNQYIYDKATRSYRDPTNGRFASQKGTLTSSEQVEIQAIATKYNTTIDVVGSRSKGEGRNIGTTLPAGKDVPGGPPTRSDIDFRVDAGHPQADALFSELQKVGGNAGSAGKTWSTNPATPGGRATEPPFIRFIP